MVKLVDLNIEGRKHLPVVTRFLKSENPDIICLQEVFEKDFNRLKEELSLDGFFLPMSDRSVKNEHYNQFFGVWGISLLHKELDNIKYKSNYYKGRRTTPLFINNYSDDRVLQIIEFTKDDKEYRIGNTHFYFTPDGKLDKGQWLALDNLMNQLKKYDHILFTGDFNAPRGRVIYGKIKEQFTDHLPENIKSTIDPNLHKVKGLSLVVDTIFSTLHYKVYDLHLKEGLSDHKAIIAYISRVD